jgi:type IV pilus assembly protein PilQ
LTLNTGHIKIDKAALVLFVLLCFIGCSGDLQSTKKDPIFEKWGTLAGTSQGHSPEDTPKKIDMPVSPDPKKSVSSVLGDRSQKLPTKPINLTMRQADLKAVLRAMAKAVNYNILVKNDLKGEVNVDFRSVPWDQAFTGLLKTHGLTYVWEGSIIRVMTIEDIEHELKQKVQMREIHWVEPLIDPVVIKIDYADPKKLEKTLESFLTKDKDGKTQGSVILDEHSNSLVISASAHDLARMIPVIEKLDKSTPQILIKANIVETSKSVARDLGIKWGGYRSGTLGGSENLIVTGGKGVPTGGIGSKGFGVDFPAGSAGAAILDATTGPLGTLGLMFGTIGGNLLELELQALQKDSKINIVSSPSITTLDNQKAFTENGRKVPFVTMQPSTTPGTPPTQTVTFQDAVMRLEITPHVIDGKNLKMKILVSKDELDFSQAANMYGNPIIVKKHTETTLIVKDGETIVISGLTKETSDSGTAGWPWLKDVPVLGWTFKADSRSRDMEEVLIFITPHILKVASAGEKSPAALQ